MPGSIVKCLQKQGTLKFKTLQNPLFIIVRIFTPSSFPALIVP